MALSSGFVIFIIVVATIVIILRNKLQKSNPTESPGYNPVVILDLQSGLNKNIQLDYMDTRNLVHAEEGTGREYVTREKGMFDGSDTKIYLNDYHIFRYSSWTLILNNTSVLGKWLTEKIIDQEKKIIQLENVVAERDTRILELETKIDDLFMRKVDIQEKMNKASREGMVLLKSKGK